MAKTATHRVRDVASAFAPLHSYLQSRIDEGLIPGAVIAAARARGKVHRAALGNRALKPRAEAMTERTIFDLASLTKPMATAPLVLDLLAEGALGTGDPVERHIRELVTDIKGQLALFFRFAVLKLAKGHASPNEMNPGYDCLELRLLPSCYLKS